MESWKNPWVQLFSLTFAVVGVVIATIAFLTTREDEKPTAGLAKEIRATYVKRMETLDASMRFDPKVECPKTARMDRGDEFVCLIYDRADPTTAVTSVRVTIQNDAGEAYFKEE